MHPHRLFACGQLLLALLPIFLHAQTAIHGQAHDERGEPLAYAGVMLLAAGDSTLVKGTVTGEDGSFQFEGLREGTFRVSLSMIGYEDYFSDPLTVSGSGRPLALAPIQLGTNSLDLEAVEVTAKRPLFEQRIDRLVVNVAESITSSGSNALEILERSPGIIVNRQSGDISMSGKSGVIIMINNKVNQMPLSALVQLLEGMPSDNIQKIELITTPPANFDAEGNAGIINIVLKKNLDEGLNGSYGLILGYGVNEKYGGNTNFNYRRGAVNVYGDYGYLMDHSYQVFENYRSFTDDGVFYENDNVSERDPYTRTQSGRLGLDVELGENTVVGLLTSLAERRWTMDAVNTVDYLIDRNLDQRVVLVNDELNQWRSYLGNLNLVHTFAHEGRFTVDLDYARYVNNSPSNYVNEYFSSATAEAPFEREELRIDKDTPIDIWVTKTDFSQQLHDNITLEAGAKGTFSTFDNDFLVERLESSGWTINPELTASYELVEKIGAAYTTLSWQLSPATGVKAGLRYEYTDSNLGSLAQPDIVDRQYGYFFPSLFFTQDIGQDQQLQLSYSRRINRPAYTQLAPFVIFLDPSTLLSGNESLQPSLIDAYRASYRWRSYFVQLEYSYEDDAIAGFQPQVDPETNQQINRPVNQDFRKNLSLSLTVPVQVTDWWNMRFNLMSFWLQNQVTLEGRPIQVESWTYGLNGQQSLSLPWDLSLEISGFFMSPVAWGVLLSDARGDVNIGLQKPLGENANLRLNLQNLFLTGNWRSATEDDRLGFTYRGAYNFQERQVRLTFSQTFGNARVKAARRRATGSSEEQQRIEQ